MKKLFILFFILLFVPAVSFSAVELDATGSGGVDIDKGGTNATTAAQARINLGVDPAGTDNSTPEFTTDETAAIKDSASPSASNVFATMADVTSGTGDMLSTNNLSDVANNATARANILGATNPSAASIYSFDGTNYSWDNSLDIDVVLANEAPSEDGHITLDTTNHSARIQAGGTDYTFAVPDNTMTFTNKSISGSSNTISNVPLGTATGVLNGAQIADDSIPVAKMADGNWGAFTITTNNAALNADAVGTAELANNITITTSGVITGLIETATDADAHTLTSTEYHGGSVLATGAGIYTLPAAAAGLSGCVEAGQGVTAIIQLLPASGDYIVLEGVRGTAATALASDGSAGDRICYRAYNGDDWYVSVVGTWE